MEWGQVERGQELSQKLCILILVWPLFVLGQILVISVSLRYFSLICIPIIIKWCWAFFHVPPGHLYVVFFGEMSTYFFCPCFDWVVCFFVVVWAVCIFWKLNSYRSHHLQIFSPISLVVLSFVYGFLYYRNTSISD